MRFLVDECAGPSLAHWLHEQGHDVFSVFDQARGINDDEVLQDERSQNKIAAMERLLANFATPLNGQFVVVTDTRVRLSSPEE